MATTPQVIGEAVEKMKNKRPRRMTLLSSLSSLVECSTLSRGRWSYLAFPGNAL
jgi:hypothetical protein